MSGCASKGPTRAARMQRWGLLMEAFALLQIGNAWELAGILRQVLAGSGDLSYCQAAAAAPERAPVPVAGGRCMQTRTLG